MSVKVICTNSGSRVGCEIDGCSEDDCPYHTEVRYFEESGKSATWADVFTWQNAAMDLRRQADEWREKYEALRAELLPGYKDGDPMTVRQLTVSPDESAIRSHKRHKPTTYWCRRCGRQNAVHTKCQCRVADSTPLAGNEPLAQPSEAVAVCDWQPDRWRLDQPDCLGATIREAA